MYIDKLDDVVNTYNNIYHRTIEMKPFDVKRRIYIDFNEENNKEGPKFNVDDHVRISKSENIFAKRYLPNLSKEAFLITKVKIMFRGHMLSVILTWKYCWKILRKKNQREFTVEKLRKRKSNKLYVKWKGYDNSFNSWIDKKRHSINEWIFSKTKIFRSKCKRWTRCGWNPAKAGLKNATGVDLSNFAKNTDLANLESDVEKLDTDKLENIPNNWSNLKNKVDKLDIGSLETALVDLRIS